MLLHAAPPIKTAKRESEHMISIRILNLQIWPILVGNCQLNRSIDLSLKDSKLFSKIEITHYSPQSTAFITYLGGVISHQIYGWATK